ncbi:MAG TPA: hypothetical protein DCL51_10890, partial [Ruthenibacterium lactatiformans]|nr:hypothetical protein [Ruthenibacterium lactatiformans]
RPHGPRRLRRRDRVLQSPQAGEPGDLRRRGAEGQCARGAQAAAPVPHKGSNADDQALQRL